MRLNILFGGKAGTGPNILTHVLAEALIARGHNVFYYRDYQSLIRGGHNFNVLTFDTENQEVYSNDSKLDIIVALDENTIKIHEKSLNKKGLILKNEDKEKKGNMYFAGRIFKLLCLEFKELELQLKKLEKRFEENMKEAKEGFNEEKKEICHLKKLSNKGKVLINGSMAVAKGAVESNLDLYYAYPMTPATGVLSELSEMQKEKKSKHKTIEIENEIAVANAGVGSAMTGKLTMVGTSGGGFDLMTETLSLTGIAEVPLVFYLAQRPGPGTGVATYTAQGDLNIALKAGHGEFQRFVVSPGDVKEAEELTNQCFYFSQKFQVPSIIISDKHLAESFYTTEEKIKLLKIKSLTKFKRYNSYEKNPETGSATEDAEIIEKNVVERMKKKWAMEKEAKKFKTHKIFGEKTAKNIVVSQGSTKGAILDAINGMEDVGFLQILYLDPFPKEVKKYLEGKNVILVENNSTGLLGKLVREQTGFLIEDRNKILRFDGRPFLADKLKNEIEWRVGG